MLGNADENVERRFVRMQRRSKWEREEELKVSRVQGIVEVRKSAVHISGERSGGWTP